MKRKQTQINAIVHPNCNKKRKLSPIERKWLDVDGAVVIYVNSFLSMDESEMLISRLLKDDIAWSQDVYQFGGKQQKSHRLVCAFADRVGMAYGYSGQKRIAHEWIQELLDLKGRVEKWIAQSQGKEFVFNYALLNQYRDERDHISWHHDDEKDLVANSPIVSISLGGPRCFQMKRYAPSTGNTIIVNENLNSGSLLVMSGTCQQLFNHRVPPTKKKRQLRINITFRCMKN